MVPGQGQDFQDFKHLCDRITKHESKSSRVNAQQTYYPN